MKKIIAVLLVLTMAIGLFAGCNTTPDVPDTTAGSDALQRARTYIFMAYKDSAVKTTVDYKVMKAATIDGVTYPIDWTVDVKKGDKEAVSIGEADKVFVTIHVKEEPSEETEYVLTATIKDDKGNSESVSFNHVVPGGLTAEQILDAAYALETGAVLDGTYKLTGVVTKINTPWDDGYKNITVTIAVPGHEDKPVQCYRLKGDGANEIAVGDTITVQGTIKNYSGTVEFDAGCEMLNRVSGGGVVETEPPVPEGSMGEIVDAAYELETDTAMSGEATLTGVVTAVNTPFDEGYQNVTVTIVVDGKTDKPIQCFRMKGDEAAKVAVGDTITVTGKLKNYKGTVEFDAGCKLTARVPGEGGETPVEPTNPTPSMTESEIVDAAYGLAADTALDGEFTLTGVVTKVNTPYDEGYKNVTVTITVAGKADKPIQCFRMKGDEAAKVAAGDTITVTGKIKNYKGTVEFDAGCVLKSRTPGASAPEPTEPKPTEPKPTEPTPSTPKTPAEIVAAAYALAEGAEMDGEYTLTGVVTKVGSYNTQYNDVTIEFTVEGKTIQCYALKAGAADNSKIAVGDTVTVTGKIKNYKGTVEFDKPVLDKLVAGAGGGSTTPEPTEPKPTEPKPTEPTPSTPKTPAEIVAAAYALGADETLSGTYTLTGVVSSVDTAWSDQFSNITVTIKVSGCEDKPIKCYRLAGNGAKDIAVGDTITVTGSLTNYKGNTVEFAQGCTLDKRVAGVGGGSTTPEPTEPKPTTPVDTNIPAATGTVTYDFTSVENGQKLTDETALTLFKGCSSNADALAGVSASTVYQGNVSGGAKETAGGLIRMGSSKADGSLVLSFGNGSKISKVEILCHDYRFAAPGYEADKLIVNGGNPVAVPKNETATPDTVIFNLDGTSNVLNISTEGRVCIYKIIVTFA